MQNHQRGLVGRAAAFFGALLLALLTVFPSAMPVLAEEGNRWGSAADEIDKYLDAGFEYYLEGDTKSAYNSVNDAYFRVYEVTGFERQTMSYISGNRKNAVEMQFSTCKANVKKEELDLDTKIKVRSSLTKLKSMIREDGNKLAEMAGEPATEMKYYLHGDLVDEDPYADLAADPNAAVKYDNWYEPATLVKETLDTAYMAYLDKDFEAALDNVDTAFYSIYEESGLSHKIYTDLSLEERQKMDAHFSNLRSLIKNATEKYQKNKYRTSTDKAKNDVLKLAKKIDEQEAEAKAAEEAALGEAESELSEVTEKQSDPRWLTFLAAFGIIVREGLEAILVIADIIAYLTKSGNGKTLKNVYIGALLGIAASFAAAGLLYYLKKVWVGAGQSQEVIEGVTALIAVCVLFYVSNWMISKAEAASWTRYIDGKVQSSVAMGSGFALAFTAFLSVFREGAEVVLFYQPMLSEGNAGMVWAGFFAGCILLVFVYLAITKLSIKLPIKVFFTATSILMAVMCVSFLGSGIKELAEGNVFDLVLRVPGIPENDVIQIFGIYPYLETLVPQLILAIILLITFMIAHYRGKIDALSQKLAPKEG
ncbi:MAG: FTR1 family iron permease [Lachnospiraceae bacterium]|nr:FTR1 family iron permease [Lachnospiraceae bacterium]